MRRLLALLLLFAAALCARADEPFLKPNDVIALIGGEDMVVANELGYLETLLQRRLPDLHLKVRSLAWEGDTVFEQHRDLNYPTLETQLDKIGATVVVVMFGKMESMRGVDKSDEFIAAYQALLARLSSGGKRRLLILSPPIISGKGGNDGDQNLVRYAERIAAMEKPAGARVLKQEGYARFAVSRDGIHLNESQQKNIASRVANSLVPPPEPKPFTSEPSDAALRDAVLAKNRLWFQYTRPQNWAFLAGDRTNQPSSRDYKDPSKRWFPEEMEQFVPLIEAKDKEIWEAAAKLKGANQ